MNGFSSSGSTLHKFSSNVLEGWNRHGRTVLKAAVSLMAVAAILWLGYQFWRLIWDGDPTGAVDLKQRYIEIEAWFAGEPTYDDLVTAVYPPASYVLLWPFLGWPSIPTARLLWALTAAASLVWLVVMLLRECRCESAWERAFVVLLPLSIYATGATIGNGQLLVHVLPPLITGLLLLRLPQTWTRDLICSVLILIALVKPNVTAPFFWIVLLVPGGFRPAALAALGYLALTLWAASFQAASAPELIAEWLLLAESGVEWGNERGGYANQSRWLARIGLNDWTTEASFAALGMWGIWIFIHRRLSIWILIGTTAVIARFWTYHPWYDDLLILLPMIAVYRIAMQQSSPGSGPTPSHLVRVFAGILVAFSLLSLVAPGGLYVLQDPWRAVYVGFQLITWSTTFFFLIFYAWRVRHPRSDLMSQQGTA